MMLQVRSIAELDPQQCAATLRLLDQCPAASAYQYPYAGASTDLLFQLERNGELCFSGRATVGLAATRLLPFFKTLNFNRGPVASTSLDLLEGITLVGEWARQNRFLKVQVMPDLEPDPALAEAMRQHHWHMDAGHQRFTLRLDISLPEAQLLASFPKTCRYKVLRAMREGIRIEQGEGPEALAKFIHLHRQMTLRKQLPAAAPGVFEALWQMRVAQNDRLGLIMAYFGEELLGANLIFRSGRRAEYLFGAVHSDHPVLHGDVTAGYPLQWGCMQWAKAAGCTLYDFGGYDPRAVSGPARLKRSFVQNPLATELFPPATLELRPALSAVTGTFQRQLSRLAHVIKR